MGDLFLAFPQWQGSGPSRELLAAVQALRPHLPDIPFTEIPVAEQPLSPTLCGVLGHAELETQFQAARQAIAAARPDRIFTLGGDCSVELAPIEALHQRHGRSLAVVWLDAHGDLNSPETSPSGYFHGMPLRLLLGSAPRWCAAPLSPSQVVLAGVRELDPPEAAFVTHNHLGRFSVAELEADPGSLAETLVNCGFREVYAHIDLDVLEPATFPPLKCPAPGGLRPETLLRVVEQLNAHARLVGFSILEFTTPQRERDLAFLQRLIATGIGDWLPSALAKGPESR